MGRDGARPVPFQENLGFLLKKGAAVARGQMKAQSTATFGRMIPALSDAELKALADYLRQRLLTA